MPCDVRRATKKIVYCLKSAAGPNGSPVIGGFLVTRSWSLLVTTAGITTQQFVKGIVPILARTGA